jgi:hypothetical protein
VSERRIYAWAAGRYDEHRNTSRVWPVPPDALPNLRRASARFQADYPCMAAWLAAGAPPVRSEREHVELFGVHYKRGVLT